MANIFNKLGAYLEGSWLDRNFTSKEAQEIAETDKLFKPALERFGVIFASNDVFQDTKYQISRVYGDKIEFNFQIKNPEKAKEVGLFLKSVIGIDTEVVTNKVATLDEVQKRVVAKTESHSVHVNSPELYSSIKSKNTVHTNNYFNIIDDNLKSFKSFQINLENQLFNIAETKGASNSFADSPEKFKSELVSALKNSHGSEHIYIKNGGGYNVAVNFYAEFKNDIQKSLETLIEKVSTLKVSDFEIPSVYAAKVADIAKGMIAEKRKEEGQGEYFGIVNEQIDLEKRKGL